MAGDMNAGSRQPCAARTSKDSEAAFTRSLRGRRFDDPGTERDHLVLWRVNSVDPNDIPEW